MIRKVLIGAGLVLGAATATAAAVTPTPGTCAWRSSWVNATVSTPFDAPYASLTFTVPSIPCSVVSLAAYKPITGTATSGIATNKAAFAQAVADLTTAGGGVLDVPAGTYMTGAITLASNIELHVESGATILFSQDTADYPKVLTRWEGLDVINYSPLVYAYGATNVAVTGPGTLDGNGSTWWGWKSGGATTDAAMYTYYVGKLVNGVLPTPLPTPPTAVPGKLRPQFVQCNTCTNFYVDGITLKNAPYWNIHPLYSTNVIIRNTTVNDNSSGTNGDGIDVDSSTNVLIEKDTFNTSDDMISIKSGLNEDGIAVGKPTQQLVIRDITAVAGHAISLGSELSGGLENILFTTSSGTNNLGSPEYLFRLKTLPGRGGFVKNVWLQNATGTWTKEGIQITTNYTSSTIAPHNKSLLTNVSAIHFANITASGSGVPLEVVGLAAAPYSNITFNAVNLTSKKSATCSTIVGSPLTFTNSTITGIPNASCP